MQLGVEIRAVYDLGYEVGGTCHKRTAAIKFYIIDKLTEIFNRVDDVARLNMLSSVYVNVVSRPSLFSATMAFRHPITGKYLVSFKLSQRDYSEQWETDIETTLSETTDPGHGPYFNEVVTCHDGDVMIEKIAERLIFHIEVELVTIKVALDRIHDEYYAHQRRFVERTKMISQMRPRNVSSLG